MNEKETSKDIIAEMRTKAECAKPYDDGIVMMLTDYADRFEAALKREQSQSWHHREMEELVLRHEKELVDAKKSSGDAAKLRRVCEQMLELLKAPPGFDGGGMSVELDEEQVVMWRDRFLDALAAPARNCDKYSHDEALRIWSAEPENSMNGCFDVWLYASATEKAGGVS